ncbi:hypothetical protein JAAARDRAFT_189925 [Jaapia argillacea MUCL 33604]|uniref:C3H1-type domain-containing protein n=1 Tax=Jaapia argillacea MUCL 33604 TaxID=933084 RepID=A0A067QJ32_9AGAM|nr:hypothetical protein JAAARDRAFT_189925 [Jaapia argillacea MUCL 33604]
MSSRMELSTAGTAPATSPPPRPTGVKRPCRYYNAGHCARGETCKFLHAPTSPSHNPIQENRRGRGGHRRRAASQQWGHSKPPGIFEDDGYHGMGRRSSYYVSPYPLADSINTAPPRQICMEYLVHGDCVYGEACPRFHPDPNPRAQSNVAATPFSPFSPTAQRHFFPPPVFVSQHPNFANPFVVQHAPPVSFTVDHPSIASLQLPHPSPRPSPSNKNSPFTATELRPPPSTPASSASSLAGISTGSSEDCSTSPYSLGPEGSLSGDTWPTVEELLSEEIDSCDLNAAGDEGKAGSEEVADHLAAHRHLLCPTPIHSSRAYTNSDSGIGRSRSGSPGSTDSFSAGVPLAPVSGLGFYPGHYPAYVVPSIPFAYPVQQGIPPISPIKQRSAPPPYKTKPCKFFYTEDGCPKGDKCTLYATRRFVVFVACMLTPRSTSSLHEPASPKVRARAHTVSSTGHMSRRKAAAESRSPHRPDGPPSSSGSEVDENGKKRNFFPITWRIIGGGVMMGNPTEPSKCRSCAKGSCTHGCDAAKPRRESASPASGDSSSTVSPATVHADDKTPPLPTTSLSRRKKKGLSLPLSHLILPSSTSEGVTIAVQGPAEPQDEPPNESVARMIGRARTASPRPRQSGADVSHPGIAAGTPSMSFNIYTSAFRPSHSCASIALVKHASHQPTS